MIAHLRARQRHRRRLHTRPPDERSDVLGRSYAFRNYLADVAWRVRERWLGRFGLKISGGGLSSSRTSSRTSHASPARKTMVATTTIMSSRPPSSAILIISSRSSADLQFSYLPKARPLITSQAIPN